MAKNKSQKDTQCPTCERFFTKKGLPIHLKKGCPGKPDPEGDKVAPDPAAAEVAPEDTKPEEDQADALQTQEKAPEEEATKEQKAKEMKAQLHSSIEWLDILANIGNYRQSRSQLFQRVAQTIDEAPSSPYRDTRQLVLDMIVEEDKLFKVIIAQMIKSGLLPDPAKVLD